MLGLRGELPKGGGPTGLQWFYELLDLTIEAVLFFRRRLGFFCSLDCKNCLEFAGPKFSFLDVVGSGNEL
jgi:hypothetical protein